MPDIALGGVGKIVEVALKIKEAVETVKQNEKECRDIQRCVARVSALLRKLDETTESMRDEVMRDALEDLAESMERALELVTECQRKHRFLRLLGAGDMAKELRRVQDDIVRKLQLGNFATNVQTTIMVTNIQSAGSPRPRLPQPTERVVTDADDTASAAAVEPPDLPSAPSFIKFSSSVLEAITENFADQNIIGKGGFGTVYKGLLRDGQVAVKKLVHDGSWIQNESLYDDISFLLNLNHKNIIGLLGYCHEIKMNVANTGDKYVATQDCQCYFVSEYMPNRSLADPVHKGTPINWSSRFKIIQGIAQGLHYLHEQRLVHMDLNPANILLDCDMNPRINDFGLVKKLDHSGDEVMSDPDPIFGSLEYMAPEYLSQGTLSTKCDVYAFGVVLLRTIMGMCISADRVSAEWAWEAREAIGIEELFDPSLCDNSQLMQIKRCMEIGLLCNETDRADRPTMDDVLDMLNGEKELPTLRHPDIE